MRFEYAEAGGVAVRKAFSVDPRAFTVDAVVEASIGGSPVNVSVVMGPGPGDVETSESNRFRMGARANLYREGKVERYDAAALDRQPLMEGVMRWVASTTTTPVRRAGAHPERPRGACALADPGRPGQDAHTFVATP